MFKYLLVILFLSVSCEASFSLSRLFHGITRSLTSKKLKLVDFSWKTCSSDGDLAFLKSLTVGPDPIHIPGNVTLSLSGKLLKTLSAPIQLQLKVEKEEFIWIHIPCIDEMGSCDYDDICSMMTKFPCPPEIKKYSLNCQCPINKGTYNIPQSTFYIRPFHFPKWLEDGKFKVKATLKTKGQEVICIQLQFKVK